MGVNRDNVQIDVGVADPIFLGMPSGREPIGQTTILGLMAHFPNIAQNVPLPIRKGEELDLVKLNDHLRACGAGIGKVQSIQQFHGGYSNLTYQLNCADGTYVLRKPPLGANIKSAHDMAREFDILCRLQGHYGQIPSPLHFSADPSVMGTDFYIMNKVDGVILKPTSDNQPYVSRQDGEAIIRSMMENLATIHQVDLRETGLDQMGRPEGYIKRQVVGWSKRYQKARTDDIPAVDRLIEWLPDHLPEQQITGFIHNDYKLDNIMLDASRLARIVAVLDWEMATVGDIKMDLGLTLTYMIEPSDHPALTQFNRYTCLDLALCRQRALEIYLRYHAVDVDDILFHFVFGNFKLAVILQQIYARFVSGHNKNPMVATFLPILTAFAQQGVRAIEQGRIGDFR